MASEKPVATALRCEYLVNPLAIDAPRPRLSWEMAGTARGASQTAYRVLAADSSDALKRNEGTLWDSGKVDSGQSLHVHYAGEPLRSCLQVFWKVRVWDGQGRAGRWSQAATFTMGLLERSEWTAEWIGNYLANSPASPLLRKEFETERPVRRALLHVTARGLHHLVLDGRPVSEDRLAPGWTDYGKRLHYRCYDVTARLRKPGLHCLGAELANGWYKGRIAEQHQGRPYGNRVGLLAQLRIEYEGGRIGQVVSDASWKTLFGPTRQADFYDGEVYDAQLEPAGWSRAGFDDGGWEPAFVLQQPLAEGTLLLPYPAEPVRVTGELKPVAFWAVAPGKVIYDFGQNFAGHVRLHVRGKAGCVVRMRFGEMVAHDKTLYIDNMRSAVCTDTYVMKGLKREVWEPKFTFHGFRYAEISGCPVPPGLANVTGVVVGSDTTRVGRFDCSSPLVNQIYSNAVWTQRANFLEVPTDCPQRDERLGWTGDAQVFIRTAICNMDVAAFFTKWMGDLLDAQYEDGAFPNVAPDVLHSRGGAAWGDAGVVCPWTLYQCYEDRELLERMYPAMQRWVAYLKDTSSNLLCETTQCFGDWLAIGANTPKAVIRTAHFAQAADIVRRAAGALGRTADAERHAQLFADIKAAFNKAYVRSDGKIESDTQTAYLMALKFGLLDGSRIRQAARHLVADIRRKDGHMATGFIGTALVLSVLRDSGNLDLAYKLLENTTFPSWGYSVVHGATTIWERWNGWTKERGPGDVGMNSYSHYAYGAVVEWMFDTIAGIDHGSLGFRQFRLCPRPGGSLTRAEATFHSPYGLIRSAWRRRGRRMRYEVTIPANTRASVILPVEDLRSVTLDGRRMTLQGMTPGAGGGFELPAGEYVMSWQCG